MELFNNLPDSFFTSIDNICISLWLGVLGIAITIFTVVYSFMESNKQAIRKLTDEIIEKGTFGTEITEPDGIIFKRIEN